MTTVQGNNSIILNAEPEHDGIRLTVILSLFVGLVLGFFLINWLIGQLSEGPAGDFSLLVACVGAFPFAFLVVFLTEFTLKRTWHSGITLTLDRVSPALVLKTAQANDRQFNLADANTQLIWFFSLKGYPRGGRERRPNKNWFCLAVEIQQDDEQLSLYAYVPPKQANALTEDGKTAVSFHQIFPPDLYDTSVRGRIGPPSRPNIPTDVIRSASGRYWLAERRRWQDGLELSPDDFETLIQFLAQHGKRKAM